MYKPEEYRDTFVGSIKSEAFNPVKAVNNSGKIKETTRQKQQNIQRMAQSAQRNYQNEVAWNNYNNSTANRQAKSNEATVKLQQTMERTQAQSDYAAQQGKASMFKGLLSLTQTGLDFYGKEKAASEKRAEEEADMNLRMESLLGPDLGVVPPPPMPEVDQQQVVADNAAIDAGAQATAQTADELRAEGGTLNESVATQLETGAGYQILRGVQGNAYSARAAFPAYLTSVIDGMPAEQRPRTYPEAQALVQSLTRTFLQESGLMGVDRKQMMTILGGTLTEVAGNAVGSLVGAGTKATQQENLDIATSQISTLVDNSKTTNMSAEQVWREAEKLVSTGGFGFTRGQAATKKALEMVLAEAVVNGNDKLIEDLREVYAVPGNKGTALGTQFDAMLDKAEEQARNKNRALFQQRQTERSVDVARIVEPLMQNPSPENREVIIGQLRELGTQEALDKIKSLTKNGLTYDPNVAISFQEQFYSSGFVDQVELKEALSRGQITQAEYNQFAKTSEDIQQDKDVDKVIKEYTPRLNGGLLGNTPTGVAYSNAEATPAMRRDVANRQMYFREDVKSRFAAEVRSRPEILDDPREISKTITEIERGLLAEPRYQIVDDPSTGYKFAAELGENFPVKTITVSPGVQNFRQLTMDQVRELGIPRSIMDPKQDIWLDDNTLKNDSTALLEGAQVSSRTKEVAKMLGITPGALVNAQLERSGRPSVDTMRRASEREQPQPSVAAPVSAKQGMAMLEGLGFTTRGAAYLAGNIQQESAWAAQRPTWGEVQGDGSDRNGGLVSWMDDAQRNHWRLTNIEKHLGKPITQATAAEQLAAMKWEMQKNYSWAYSVFTNPKASKPDLIAASKAYWGYGHEGSRYQYADSLLR